MASRPLSYVMPTDEPDIRPFVKEAGPGALRMPSLWL